MELATQEDELVRGVFAITLDANRATTDTNPPVVHLAGLAEELSAEASGAQMLLTKDNLERALMARLMEPPDPYPQWPIAYLLGAFSRASERNRALPRIDASLPSQRLLAYCKELAVSYTGLLLTMDMFPQPDAARQRGVLQLLDALEARLMHRDDQPQMPPDFLEQFAARFEEEGLPDLVNSWVANLVSSGQQLHAMDDITGMLGALSIFSTIRPLARCLVASEVFLPKAPCDGRKFSRSTALGAAFCLAVLTDRAAGAGAPSVRDKYLSDLEARSQTELNSVVSSLRVTVNQLVTALHAIVLNLLKKDTRERMLQWLFASVEMNAERAKSYPDYRVAASDGFFMNLAAVCIKLCQPFIQPSAKTWARIDARYVSWNSHISFVDETKLSATREEEQKWVAERQAAGGNSSTSSPPDYTFICESFFLTAKVLHLGPVAVLAFRNRLMKQLQRTEEEAKVLERMLPSMTGPTAALHRRQCDMLLKHLDHMRGDMVLLDTHMQDPAAMGELLSYCRLMAAWLLHLACPSSAPGADIQLPLPASAPMEFRTLPEYFLEDLLDILEWVAQALPQVMDALPNNEFVNVVIVFLGSPAYIKNAHLRAKLIDLLHIWVAPHLAEDQSFNARRLPSIAAVSQLIEWHPLVQQNMVRGLLQLFHDVEHTDRSNTFYEKFNTRYKAGEILLYLWTIPAHREVWKALAAEQGGKGLYLAFADVICNDSQYLLDDVIRSLPEIRELEELMADTARWDALPPQERKEKQQHFNTTTHNLQADIYLAGVYVRLLRRTTEDITHTWLLPEMVERIASMLTYFMDALVGKQKRKTLRVRDPEKYRWRPQELLAELAHIYLHLSAADRQGSFVAAIAADQRSYHEGLFSEAADVLRKYGLLSEEEVDAMEALGESVGLARLSAAQEEDVLGDVPDEFLDPLLGTVMQDPVTLPGSQMTVERSTIERHLLSAKTDPFNRSPLTVDMLQSNAELKGQIEAWKAAQRQRQRSKPMDQS